MKKGYPTRISYDQMLPNFDTYLPSETIGNQRKLANFFLLAIGCEKIDFKLGETHVFFRPGKSTLFHQYNMSDTTVIKDLASKIQSQVNLDIQLQEEKKSEHVQIVERFNILRYKIILF